MAGPIRIRVEQTGAQAAARDLDGLSTRAAKVGDGFKRMALPALGALGGLAAGAKSAIDAASDLSEETSKSGVVFGKQADEITRFAKSAASSLGQSERAARDATSTFGLMAQKAGLSGKETADFAKKFTVLASDLASFNNKSPEQAIEAIGAAMRGEAEPIRAFGVTLDEATLKAEALALGLLKPVKDESKIRAYQVRIMEGQKAYNEAVAEHGKKSLEALKAEAALGTSRSQLAKATEGVIAPLTQQQKLLATQSVIMKQTTAAQGDFARTSEGAANQSRIMAAESENLRAKLGESLLPAYVKLQQILLAVTGYVANNTGKVTALAAVIGVLAAGVLLVNGVMAVAGAVMTVYGAGQALLAKNAARAAAGQWALNAAMLANPIGLVVVALVALGAGLVIAYKKSETFRNIVNGAWAAVRAATGAVFGWVQDKVSSVMTFIGTTLPAKARSAVEGAVNAWTSLRERTTAMFEAVVTAVRQKIGNVVETVTGLKDKVTGALSGAGTWLTEIGKNIIQGLVDGLDAAKQWVIDKIQQITDSIPGWVKKRLGIASPSKVMAELGREAGRGLVVGLDGERSQVERSADLLARTLVKGFGSPQLTARAVVAGTPGLQLGAAGRQTAPGSSGVMRVEFTAEQLHEIERGRRVTADIRAYAAAGGKVALS